MVCKLLVCTVLLYVHQGSKSVSMMALFRDFFYACPGHALGIWICGCSLFYKWELMASKLTRSHSTKSLKIISRKKVISQRSAGLCTRCTCANVFPVANTKRFRKKSGQSFWLTVEQKEWKETIHISWFFVYSLVFLVSGASYQDFLSINPIWLWSQREVSQTKLMQTKSSKKFC